MNDKTWKLTIEVQVTTMNGWEPEDGDVESWLDNGGLELIRVVKIEESK